MRFKKTLPGTVFNQFVQNPTIAQLAQQLSQFEVQPSISDLLVLQASGQNHQYFVSLVLMDTPSIFEILP